MSENRDVYWLDDPERRRSGPETCPACHTKWSLLCQDTWHPGSVFVSGWVGKR